MEPLRALIVDDEPGMRMGVARVLEDYSFSLPEVEGEICFSPLVADSGEKALALMEREMPDILLLDYKLPGIDGLEVLKRVANRATDMLTIMMTAYASIETAVTATKRGAYDFLPKPFTPEEIKNVLRKTAARIILARQARQLAEEKRAVRFEFIRVLGHELKSPIAAVEGYLRLVHDRALGDDLDAYAQMISRGLLRLEYMRKLIRDLLDMTRIESGRKTREITNVDAREVADMVVEGVACQAEERGIAVNLRAPKCLQMNADRGEIEMILNNLVSNAVKYNREGGKVDVTLTPDEGGVVIEVKDNGIGMTEKEKARLFGEFVRIRNEQTSNILGSGLGLSIVKRLVDLYDGAVSVESEPGAGSVFTVRLGNATQ